MSSSFLETIKAVDGSCFHLTYHQKRYESVLSTMGAKKHKRLLEYLNPPKRGLYRCRVLYTKDTIEVSYHNYIKRQINALKIVYDDRIEYSLKSAQRDRLTALYQKRESCDDVIIVKNSYITDTSIANIALLSDGVWFTPKNPLLRGTTRERLLTEKKIYEKDILVDDINRYEKIALLNAMIDFDIIQKDIKELIC